MLLLSLLIHVNRILRNLIPAYLCCDRRKEHVADHNHDQVWHPPTAIAPLDVFKRLGGRRERVRNALPLGEPRGRSDLGLKCLFVHDFASQVPVWDFSHSCCKSWGNVSRDGYVAGRNCRYSPDTVSHPREQDARFPEIVPLHAKSGMNILLRWVGVGLKEYRRLAGRLLIWKPCRRLIEISARRRGVVAGEV